jgi:nicotinamide mononucleotide transporter
MSFSDSFANTALEISAVATSLIFTWLATKERRSAWIFGIGSALFTGIICYQSRLFAELSLQIYYLGISVYSLQRWRSKENQFAHLTISNMPAKLHIIIIVLGLLLTLIMGWFWTLFNAALPYLDAFTTAYSLIAVWLLARKYLQSWIYWIVIDAVSVILYAKRDLNLMAGLFVAYTILAIYGFIKWSATKKQK